MRLRVDPARQAEAAAALAKAGGRVRRRLADRLWVDTRNAHGGLEGIPGIAIEGPAAVVTAVGPGLGSRLDLVVRAEQALRDAKIELVYTGAEADTAWWDVRAEDLDAATRIVHDALIGRR